MTTASTVGSVQSIWRFPVKSMQGEQLESADVTQNGILGDRAYAIIDTETGKVASAKSVKLFPGLLACGATYVTTPAPGHELPPVTITLGDGRVVTSDAGDIDPVLSDYFGRTVTLARTAPEDFTIDMFHPDLENPDPATNKDAIADQKLGSAYFAAAELESPVPVGSFFDLFPLSVLTTSTLARLAELKPESRFDQRRFRMNVIVDSTETGFAENDWVGCELALGDNARITVAVPDARCVMTTLAQGDLAKDTDVLRTLARHNMVQVGTAGPMACAGVYAIVKSPGVLRTGDIVVLD